MFELPKRRPLLTCLLGSAAASLLSLAQAKSQPYPSVFQDMGRTDPGTLVSATLWLRPHDGAAFEAAVVSRTTRGPGYHRWMTPGEVADAGPTRQDVARLAESLRSAGLTVEPRGTQGDALRVTGSAQRMGAAFSTTLRDVEGTIGTL